MPDLDASRIANTNELFTRDHMNAVKSGEVFASMVDAFVNNMSLRREAKVAAEQLSENHRTLQQGTFGLALAMIFALSQNDTDARNERAVYDAKKICELLEIKSYDDILYMAY